MPLAFYRYMEVHDWMRHRLSGMRDDMQSRPYPPCIGIRVRIRPHNGQNAGTEGNPDSKRADLPDSRRGTTPILKGLTGVPMRCGRTDRGIPSRYGSRIFDTIIANPTISVRTTRCVGRHPHGCAVRGRPTHATMRRLSDQEPSIRTQEHLGSDGGRTRPTASRSRRFGFDRDRDRQVISRLRTRNRHE